MELTLENIQESDDPYQAFVDAIKDKETFRKYRTHLHTFLKQVSSKIYLEILGKEPESDSLEELATFFVKLARKEPKMVHSIIAAFIKEDRKKVEEKKISPNTFPTHVKPIRKLLDANAIAIHWKSLHVLYPRGAVSQDRAYTKEELQKMMEVATDLTDKVIVTVFSSGGFRVESWNYFTWKDVVFFKNTDGSFKGAGLLVYRGDPESYWTHITPEACNYLTQYKELWKSQTGKYPQPDDPLLKVTKTPFVKRLNAFGVKKRVERLTKKIGLRDSLPEGKRRYEVPLNHGFRKYFNTMLRRAKVDYLDKEDMMGHTTGLEKHYERYNEEDFERFPEYQKAIPFLTISDMEQIKLENKNLRIEKTELQKTQEKLEQTIAKVNELYADKQRMENFKSKS